MSNKTILPKGGFAQFFHAVFEGKKQLTHWDVRKDNTLSSFRRSQQGKDLRAGKRMDRQEFTLRSQVFVTPPRTVAA